MKILHTVQLYHPAVGGSEEVIKQLSERLSRRGHDVTVATAFDPRRSQASFHGVKVEQFHLSGNEVLGIKVTRGSRRNRGNFSLEREKKRYQEFVVDGNFDVVLNYGTEIWSTDLVFPYLSDIRAKKFLVPVGFQGLKKTEYAMYYERMPRLLAQYDKVIYLSKYYQDAKFGEEHGLCNGVVIPNAASEDEFQVSPEDLKKARDDFRKRYNIRTPYMILLVANHYFLKRHYFVLDAFRRLHRSDVSLVIIGGSPSGIPWFSKDNCYWRCLFKSLLYKNLVVPSHVSREDTVHAFQAADLFVLSSSFECSPLVIFEAMAAKTPFISTDCGNVKDFKDFGVIVETPSDMAGAIRDWLDAPVRRAAVGAEAYQYWLSKFTWEKITDQYEQLYEY